MRFTVVLVPDGEGNGYTAIVPTLGRGLVTEGATVPEALAMVRDLIPLYLTTMSAAEAELELWRDGEPAGTAVATVDIDPSTLDASGPTAGTTGTPHTLPEAIGVD